MAGQVGSLEFPFVPPGYDPNYVYRLALAYAQQHAGYQPHMIMQEGHLETQGGVPGVYIKYQTPQGSSTEWTPLPPQNVPGVSVQPTPQTIEHALTGDFHPRLPDTVNPAARAYAQRRLGQARNLGLTVDEELARRDPAAAWRLASQGVGAAAHQRGYANPRQYLARGNARTAPSRREAGVPSGPPTPFVPHNIDSFQQPIQRSGNNFQMPAQFEAALAQRRVQHLALPAIARRMRGAGRAV